EMSEAPFVIRWEIDEVSKLDNVGRDSPISFNYNLPWKLSARCEPTRRNLYSSSSSSESEDDAKYLGLYLNCNWESESEAWSCDFSLNLILINIKPEKNVCNEVINQFVINDTDRGSNMISWDELIDPKKGFVKDDKITVEAHVRILNINGVRPVNVIDYSTSPAGLNNVVLVVEGKKLHVSKDYLAVLSPVLSAMFFGEFDEKNKKEIELKDVKYEEFIDLLNMTYPTSMDFNATIVKHVLKLADRFQIKCVIDRAESYLIGTKKFETVTKLILADQYNLGVLKAHCFSLYSSLAVIKSLKSKPEYKELSKNLKADFFDKIMNL
ncbi:hypothetical protein PFISCL1PPCAC_21270, partial [Pristionchus fissidentatus]